MNFYLVLALVIVGVCRLESAEIGSSRIIGGTEVSSSRWSFMVSLQLYTEVTFLWQKYPVYQHFCAGSLTADTKFVTAAHCVVGITDFRNYSIYAGITNLQDTRGIRKVIKACVISTLYVAGYPGVADAAICEITEAFVPALVAYTDVVTAGATVAKVSKIVVTAGITADAPVYANNTACRVAGWGSLSMVNLGTGYYSNALQELSLPILDSPSCARMWPKTTITTNHLCTQQVAFSGNCFADSGGPLICGTDQIGIIIGGNTICAVGQPDIYTRCIAAFSAWL